MEAALPSSEVLTEIYFDALNHYNIEAILGMMTEHVVCDMCMGNVEQTVIGTDGMKELYKNALSFTDACTLTDRDITIDQDCKTTVTLTFTINMKATPVFHALQTINWDGHLIQSINSHYQPAR